MTFILKEMLVTEALLGLLSAFPMHKWLLCATIRLILSSSKIFWITVTAGGACLLYQGLTRLQGNVNDNDTEEEKRASANSEEEDDSETDEDSSAWMTVNDSGEDD